MENEENRALEAMEMAATKSEEASYVFRLFVANHTPKSLRAIENIKALCEKHFMGRYDLEIVDLLKNPKTARLEQIVAVPTLVKKYPLPIRKFVGDLSSSGRILMGLGFPQ